MKTKNCVGGVAACASHLLSLGPPPSRRFTEIHGFDSSQVSLTTAIRGDLMTYRARACWLITPFWTEPSIERMY
jgi:hypothetical protein